MDADLRIRTATDKAGPLTNIVSIGHSYFSGGEVPKTEFSISYIVNDGFLVRMHCFEKDPFAKYTRSDEPVYKDSCMEFFADFFPISEQGYINFEVNSKGAMLCMLGQTRKDRRFVKEMDIKPPQPIATVADDGWSVELFIPLSFIERIYGRCDFAAGSIIRGNFYKCGDCTAVPHWGSWHSLGDDPMDFHQPETFGTMIVE